MKKTIYFLILNYMIFLTACEKDPMGKTRTVYTGDPVIEFASPNGSFAVSGGVLTKSITTTTTPKTDSIRIQLVAPQRSTPTNITITQDPATTAILGTDYLMTNVTGNILAIPPNSSWFTIYFQINKVNTPKIVKISLVNGDNVKLSENYKSMQINLK